MSKSNIGNSGQVVKAKAIREDIPDWVENTEHKTFERSYRGLFVSIADGEGLGADSISITITSSDGDILLEVYNVITRLPLSRSIRELVGRLDTLAGQALNLLEIACPDLFTVESR